MLCIPFLFTSTTFSILKRSQQKKTQQWFEYARHQAELNRIENIQNETEINTRVKKMQDDVYEETLQELVHITGEKHQNLKMFLNIKRLSARKKLNKNAHAIHDPNIPADIYHDICQALHEDQINPNSIKLKYIDNPDNLNLTADARGSYVPNYAIDGHIIFKKPRIRLYSALLNMPRSERKFIYEHEKNHVILQHSLIDMIALSFDLSFDGKKLTSIGEREADIHAASRNSMLACTGAKHRCLFGHRAILDNDKHCQQMQIMCALMQQKEKLESNS
jgi:hypothetical protein